MYFSSREEPFDYIRLGEYMIMPPGLPDRFYPTDPERVHREDDYVICFAENIPDDIKKRFIKDYAVFWEKNPYG